MFQVGSYLLSNSSARPAGIRIAIRESGIDPIFFFKRMNRPTGNDGGRITWSAAGFITYTASHLRLPPYSHASDSLEWAQELCFFS